LAQGISSSLAVLTLLRVRARVKMTDGPTLNCEDLPEANIWPRPLRQRNAHQVRRHRAKLVGLPVLSEVGDEDGHQYNTQDELQPGIYDREGHARNPASAVQGAAEAAPKAPLIGSAPSLDWPPLPEAWEVADSWIDCDVSSVASSWLDVGDAAQYAGEDSEADIILVSEAEAPKRAGPPSWSAIVGKGVGTGMPPVQGVAAPPPFSRKLVVKVGTKSIDEDDLAADLDKPNARPAGHHRITKKR